MSSFDQTATYITSVHRAIEIIDSRVRDWDITLVDTIADNASCGADVMRRIPELYPNVRRHG
mgnify:CR=1 FL=1